MWLLFIHGPTVVLHRSVCLFFYQCHAGFVTVALSYNLKSGVVILLALFLLRLALAVQSHFGLYMKFSIVFFYLWCECRWDFDGDHVGCRVFLIVDFPTSLIGMIANMRVYLLVSSSVSFFSVSTFPLYRSSPLGLLLGFFEFIVTGIIFPFLCDYAHY